jgi:hypothetical protein
VADVSFRDVVGVQYIKEVQLPGGTVELRGQDISIENSFFLNLAYMGKAALTFSEMRVTIENSTFVTNNNSAGRPLMSRTPVHTSSTPMEGEKNAYTEIVHTHSRVHLWSLSCKYIHSCSVKDF